MRSPVVLLALASAWVPAADLAVWRGGPGTIAEVPATRGAAIAEGVVVASGPRPARITLSKAPETDFFLAPNSSVLVDEREDILIVTLRSGTVQADVRDKGPYREVHVIGAAFDVRVTGTLFLVERVKADTDYIALLEGRVKVSLREEVAKVLGQTVVPVELSGNQGLEASAAGGFGAVAALTSRPSLPTTTETRSVRAQVTDNTPAPVAGPAVVSGGGVAETGAATAATVPDVNATTVTSTVTEQVRQSVTESVSATVTTQVQAQVQQTIVQTLTSVAPLGTPPGPPTE